MPPRGPKAYPTGVNDSVEDYADLLAEMGVDQSAQGEVFEIIRDFRNIDLYLRTVKTGTTKSHHYLNDRFIRPGIGQDSDALQLSQAQ